MQSILTVCIGNICRSPMAQALLAAELPHMRVVSAGVGALVGRPPDPLAQALMRARGLEIGGYRAQQIDQPLCQGADLILTMDEDQRKHIEARFPLNRGKVFRLGDVAGVDIPDPYRRGPAAFQNALQLIDAGVQAWAERIRKLQ